MIAAIMPAAHLPFWLLTYALAALAWLCVARFVWERFVPPDSTHPVSQALRLATDGVVAAAALVTPRAVPRWSLAAVAATWVFVVRGALSVVLLMGLLAGGAP